MKFNPEEISLCKLIAEKHRKEIRFGDWYSDYRDNSMGLHQHERTLKNEDKVFPLWTISDCLEFLAERGLWIIGFQQDEDEWSVGFAETDELGMRAIEETQKWEDGNTPLEAGLKAVLAVLEEEK